MRNKKVYGLVGIAALAAVGGTFAYYSSTQTFSNPFNTTNYSTSSTEKFNPTGENKEWKPGAEIDKDVYATNTGDGEVWVRIKFDEEWERDNKPIGKKWTSIDDTFNTVNGFTASKDEGIDSRYQDKIIKTVDGKEIEIDDGEIKDDKGSVVFKKYEDGWTDKWFFNENDGYFYYKTSLTKGESTSKLLDSVTLCGDTDMGWFDENTYVYVLDDIKKDDEGNEIVPIYDEKTAKDWVKLENQSLEEYLTATYKDKAAEKYVYTYQEHKLDEKKAGYANADYALNITVEFVQADDGEAAYSLGWQWTPVMEDGINQELPGSEEEIITPEEP